MSTVAPISVVSSRRNRSAITNGSWLLEGVDNRKAAGRRYRDLCMSYADDLGGADRLTTAQEATIRQLAGVTVEAERLQARIVQGDEVDHEQLVRLSNLQARMIAQLGLRQKKPDEVVPSLAELLAKRGTSA